MTDKNDKEFVVVVNGQRASGLLTEDEAKKKAAMLQPTQESEKGCQPKAEVKQHICG